MTTADHIRIRLAIAAYFAENRAKLNVTQREVSDALKVHPSLVSRVETANDLASVDTIIAFIDLFAEHYKLSKFVYPADDTAPLTIEQAGRTVEHLLGTGLTGVDIGNAIGYSDTTVYNMKLRRSTLTETRSALYRFAKGRLGDVDFTQPFVAPAPAQVQETPATPAPTVTTVRTPTSVRCKLVAREKLADELTFDGTPYTFQALPDGQILVTQGA